MIYRFPFVRRRVEYGFLDIEAASGAEAILIASEKDTPDGIEWGDEDAEEDVFLNGNGFQVLEGEDFF